MVKADGRPHAQRARFLSLVGIGDWIRPARGDRLSSSPASAPSYPDPPCLTDGPGRKAVNDEVGWWGVGGGEPRYFKVAALVEMDPLSPSTRLSRKP